MRVWNSHVRVEWVEWGEGWLVNVAIAVDDVASEWTANGVVDWHEDLLRAAMNAFSGLSSGDHLQVVTGESRTPRQYFKQVVEYTSNGPRVGERYTIHEL